MVEHNGKQCENCKYRTERTQLAPYNGALCYNPQSRYYMQWVSKVHRCDQHEWREDAY